MEYISFFFHLSISTFYHTLAVLHRRRTWTQGKAIEMHRSLWPLCDDELHPENFFDNSFRTWIGGRHSETVVDISFYFPYAQPWTKGSPHLSYQFKHQFSCNDQYIHSKEYYHMCFSWSLAKDTNSAPESPDFRNPTSLTTITFRKSTPPF